MIEIRKKIQYRSQNGLIINIVQNIFCVQQEKEMHIGLKQYEGDEWFSFLGGLSL